MAGKLQIPHIEHPKSSKRFCSFAAGQRAKAQHDGAFVWADSQASDFASTADNQVSFRCLGGVRFTSGSGAANQTVSWTPGSASWSFSSDRNLKDRFAAVDSQSVLEGVARLPLAEWSYKGYDQKHFRPMAQAHRAGGNPVLPAYTSIGLEHVFLQQLRP